MTETYNPYQPPASTVAATGTRPDETSPDRIAALDVSEKWKRRFRLIEQAGGARMSRFRELTASERRAVQFNFIAFFLGPFYYLAKGLWRQALVYVLLAVALVITLELIGLGTFAVGVGYGFAAVYALRANFGYYSRCVLEKPIWI